MASGRIREVKNREKEGNLSILHHNKFISNMIKTSFLSLKQHVGIS